MKKILKGIARYLGFEVRRIPPPPKYLTFDETMVPDYGALKAFTARAAQFTTSPNETQAVRNLHLLGLFGEQRPAEYSRVEIGSVHTLEVGQWRRVNPGKESPFVRTAGHDRLEWADRESIEPRRCKWRVAFIGESVARGYLYDPEFTPASALEGLLKSYLGATQIDVVDLAKSSLTMAPLKTLIGQSLALRPDVIVVMAGNNWHLQLTETDIPYVESVLRKDGVPGLKSYLDAKMQHSVRQLTAQMARVLDGKGVTIIWVVPEFNLGDWVDPVSEAPLLPGQGNNQWRNLRARAEQAFRERDFRLAQQLAHKMVALDGGTNAVPLRILAECCRGRGDLQGTRRYLEMCRDAEGWNPSFAYTPRTSSTIQSSLREVATAPNNIVIDLPEIFGRFFHDALPNRRIFLDYCHLTAEGINVAMAAVASKVLSSLTGRNIPLRDIHARSVPPSPAVEGKASFLAAVHNAHFYQGSDIVRYCCERALRFWPEGVHVMESYADVQTRRVPLMACKSAIHILENGSADALRHLFRGRKQRLDLILNQAIVESLGTIGLDVSNKISALRYAEHSIRTGPKELTDFYYSSAIPIPNERAWTSRSFATNRNSRSIYASALCERSKFVFFGEEGEPIDLRFTYRIPYLTASDATVEIEINGCRAAQVTAGRTWRTLRKSISGRHVVNGLNEITVIWPGGEDSCEGALDRAADALLARRAPEFYRVFGEIHGLSVSTASSVSGELCGMHSADSDRTPYTCADREITDVAPVP